MAKLEISTAEAFEFRLCGETHYWIWDIRSRLAEIGNTDDARRILKAEYLESIKKQRRSVIDFKTEDEIFVKQPLGGQLKILSKHFI